jgi:hypothetical protein
MKKKIKTKSIPKPKKLPLKSSFSIFLADWKASNSQ